MPQSESPDAVLANILTTLESDTIDSQEKCEAYDTLSRTLTGSDVTFSVQEVSKNIGRLLNVVKDDVASSKNDVKKKALQLLGTCIFDTEIVSHMGKRKCEEMLGILLNTINGTKEKSTCSLALWCLKSQNIDDVVISEKTEEILSTVEYAMEKWSAASVSVVDGFIGTVERLTSQAPKEMSSKVLRWGKLLVPLVVNKAVQVRETALAVIENNMDTLKTVQRELVTALKPAMKQKILPELKDLFKENRKMSVYVLKCWGTLIYLYGEELHNLSYINQFMAVVELGFKSAEPTVKIAAFQAWQKLIDNFALNQYVIQDPKKISLIMQVFKHNNTRTESVAMEKLSCWWHFLWMLGDKVSPNFELVADPLLNFCVGGRPQRQSVTSTPRSLPPSSTQPTFRSLQLLGCEALAHFLGRVEDGRELHHKFKLDPFTHRIVMGPSFYIKHAEVLITTASQLCTSLGEATPDGLALHCWEWLIAHLETAIDSPGKLDIRKTLSVLLLEFRSVVNSNALPNATLLTLFERLGTIQKRVLCSSAYSVQGDEMIHGTPALFITRLLLSPTLLQTSSRLDSYHDTFSFLLESGAWNSTGTLGFLQSVMEILKDTAPHIDDKETLWRLWSAVENRLLQHISKTSEINQGDSLEHDFGCSVQTLIFPFIQDLHKLPQSLVKILVKSWSELYKTVNRLAALVANADTNIVGEEVCSQVLDHYLEKDSVEATEVDILVQMCHVVVTSLYFSSIGNQPVFKMLSPKKFAKNRHKPLDNINSVVVLLGLLQEKTVTLVPDCENFKKSTGVSLQMMLNNLVETFSTIFVHVTSSSVISNLIGQLARPIGALFADSHNKTLKVYNNAFQSKLEKFWLDICTCLQSRYSSLFDSDFLEKLSPLLEATFLHPRRQIKNQTMSLWACTFGKAACLQYPESLKPVLCKVKAKTTIELPNWVTTISSPVIDETPVSQMTQGQAPEPRIPGMPSPHKIYGSFLNKQASPNPKKSPVRTPVSPVSKTSEKKKLDLNRFNDQDFVLIKPAPKKRMNLTEHQKEVLKEKSVIPAMYNTLEHSMDASLMAAHFTTDSQMEGSLSETPTPTTEPASLFGSVIPPTYPEEKDDVAQNNNSQPDSKGQKSAKKSLHNFARKHSNNDLKSVIEQSHKRLEKESSGDTWTKFESNEEIFISPRILKEKKENSKVAEYQDSCIVIDDDDLPAEFGNDKEQSDEGCMDNDGDFKDVDLDNDNKEDILGVSCELNFRGKIDRKKTSELTKNFEENTKVSGNGSQLKYNSDGKNVESDSSGKSGSEVSVKDTGSTVPGSVPQNVLGALDFFQSSSNNSWFPKTDSSEKGVLKLSKDGPSPDEIASTDESDLGDSRTVVSKDLSPKQEKSSSQPLQSWTQKLNELSNSPGPVSPLRKWSSQSTGLSPGKKSRSSKSPKRGKKAMDENEEKGTLEKWVIRTPPKGVEVNKDAIVIPLSQTLVEETQSPTKFASEKMKGKMSSSILETPPKNVLENITISHSNSNRKLFPSQSRNEEFPLMEDSNIVPASPNSKSFRCGTPVLKLKKLTDEEIMIYSPSRRKNKDMLEAVYEHSLSESLQKTKRAFGNFETNKPEKLESILDNESSHEHDDFSVFTPLETETKETKKDAVFSESITDSEKDMLNMAENESENVRLHSGSENLFSQSETDFVTEGDKVDSFVLDSNEDNMEKISEPFGKVVSDTTVSAKEEGKVQCTEDSQDSNDTEKNDKLEVENSEKVKVGRGRKRKQITPKKLTPEEIKPNRKKDEVDSRNAAKGLCRKLRVQTEKTRKGSPEEKSLKKEKCGKRKKSEENAISKEIKIERKKKGNISPDEGTRGKKRKISSNNSDKTTHEKAEKESVPLNDTTNDIKPSKVDILDKHKNTGKESKECDKVTDSVNCDNVCKGETEIPVCETEEITPEQSLPCENGEGKVVDHSGKSSEMIHKSKDEPVVQMEVDAPFVAVKLNDAQFQNSLESKTEGTMDSLKVDDDGITEDCNDKNCVGDKDADQLKCSGKELSQNHTGEEKTEQDDSFFSDDDIPIAEMKNRLQEQGKEQEKVTEKTVKTRSVKQNAQPSRTGLRKSGKKSEELVKRKVGRKKKSASDECETVKESVTTGDILKEDDQSQTASEPVKPCENFTEVRDKLKLENDVNRIDETPRKEVDVSKSSVAVRLMMRHSDSKLTYGSRKFEKKGGAARRSILKPTRNGLMEETNSPQRKPFHPITVGRIYSPTASPSASILKGPKRKWSEDESADTESPPAKQRRVSFATPLADVTQVDLARPPSPLVKLTGKTLSQDTRTLTQSGKSTETQSTQGSPSPNNYESTQDTQIDTTDPVCPQLIGCDQSVEKILPQLMASSWSKGLSNLVRARNIHTIGDLSSLTENDIHNLPIRSPKVDTVKKVLTKFAESNPEQLKQKIATASVKECERPSSTATTGRDIGEPVNVPSFNDDILDDINQSESPNLAIDRSCDQSVQSQALESASKSKPEVNLTDALLQLADNEGIDVHSLSANELVKISQNLTALLSKVNKAIENVVSTRCSSPWR